MYSWAILLVTMLFIYAFRIYKRLTLKNVCIFGLLSLLCIYTHYYGLMAAGLINLALLSFLCKEKRKKDIMILIIVDVIQVVAYIPWLINFLTQISNVSKGFWVSFTFPNSLIELLSFEFLGGSIIKSLGFYQYALFFLTLVFYIYIGIKLKSTINKSNRNVILGAIFIYFGVVIAALIITLFIHSVILYYRYLFVIT